MAEEYSIVYIYLIFLIQSSIDGHLGCFHVLAIVNSAAMNMQVHVSFLRRVLSGYVPKSGIAWSYGSSMYSFLRYQMNFQKDLDTHSASYHDTSEMYKKMDRIILVQVVNN